MFFILIKIKRNNVSLRCDKGIRRIPRGVAVGRVSLIGINQRPSGKPFLLTQRNLLLIEKYITRLGILFIKLRNTFIRKCSAFGNGKGCADFQRFFAACVCKRVESVVDPVFWDLEHKQKLLCAGLSGKGKEFLSCFDPLCIGRGIGRGCAFRNRSFDTGRGRDCSGGRTGARLAGRCGSR